MLNHTNQLNDRQLKDLERLTTVCKKKDGSVPNLYTHILAQPRALPASRLHYEDGQMMGFLSVYFFYDDAVEIGLLVHPLVRRRGIAKQLIQSIMPLVQTHHFHHLIFSSPSHLNDHWLPQKGLTFLHSEYYMVRDDLNPLLDAPLSLIYRQATAKDIPVLLQIDEACFTKKESKPVDRFEQMLGDRQYLIILVFRDNQPIGKAHFRWEDKGATLSDIAILPVLQGKGLGTALIRYCINYALSEGKSHLSLDVETHNQRALNLYTKLGFRIENACDYWTIDLQCFAFALK